MVPNDMAVITLSIMQGYDRRMKYFTKFVMSQRSKIQNPALHSTKSN